MRCPEWVEDLASHITDLLRFVDASPPLGCHVHELADRWEIALFAADTEIVGGPRDGQRHPDPFVVNLGELLGLFDEIREMTWQSRAVSAEDELGGHLSIDGIYAGERARVNLLIEAPRRLMSAWPVDVPNRALADF